MLVFIFVTLVSAYKRKKKQGTEKNRTVAEQRKGKQNLNWKYSNNKEGKGFV
jgi:hypothetical protein